MKKKGILTKILAEEAEQENCCLGENMKRSLTFVFLIIMLASCATPTASTPEFPDATSADRTPSSCGNGKCNGQENAVNCPQDCPAGITAGTPPAPSLEPGQQKDTYWITNPASGARLYMQVVYPNDWNGELLPALILVPGGTGTIDNGKAQRLSREGFLVIFFDPDGRGKSEGSEDYDGYIQQDGLAAVIRSAVSLPGLDVTRFGMVSYSYGVTMATGALARYPDLPIRFYIDWEGPVARTYTTTGCQAETHDIQWQPCDDDAWWSEREALAFIPDVQVPYQRVQSEEDHVQINNDHAIDIVNAAVAAGLPWVRLNDYPPNQMYNKADPPAMIPEAQDKQLEKLIARYAWDIITNVLPGLP